MKIKNLATLYAILAAALYAVNVPLSKLLLDHIGPTMLAAFLYLGAGVGLLCYGLIQSAAKKGAKNERLTKKELPYTVAMVLLDIAAPILLMLGITMTGSANVSLLNNFEIVATSVIALVIFKEVISRRLWLAIALVTVASIILTFEGEGALVFNKGSLFVLGACLCWGFENNCTRMISNKSSVEIVIIKGIFSGLGSLVVALLIRETIPPLHLILYAMVLGFFAYGISIHFYILAQKELGAAKTSAYYSIAPFLGVVFSILILRETPGLQFWLALIIMIISTFIMVKDNIKLQHTHDHEHIHTHSHSHDGTVHIHEHTHVHSHTHIHGEDSENHTHNHELADHQHNH